MSDGISRRTVLRNGSAGALSIGIAGLAGCTSSIPFIGGDDGIEFETWLFTPSFSDAFDDEDATVDDSEVTSKVFSAVVPEAIYDNEEELDSHGKLYQGSDFRGRTGLAAMDIDWNLSQTINWEYELDSSSYSRSGSAEIQVASGDFDGSSVESNLEKWVDDEYNEEDNSEYGSDDDGEEETTLESAGSESDFDLYEVTDEDYAFGVSEDYVIQVETSMDAVAIVEAAIDAHENGNNLWTDGDDADELLSQLEGGDITGGGVQQPNTVETELESRYDDPDDADDDEREEIKQRIDDWAYGLVGRASAYNINGDSTDVQAIYLYESESDADSDALSEHIDGNRDYREEWHTLEDYSVSDEGRMLILSGEMNSRTI